MGLQTTRPGGIIRKEDVSIAKNYLDDEELETLNRIVKVRQSVTIDWTLPMSTAVSTPTEPLYPSGVFRPAYRSRSRSRGPFPRVHTGSHIRYLGGTRPDNARFVPQPPHEVAARMVALERFLLKLSLWNERKRLIEAVLRSALSRVGLGNAPILFRSSCHLLLLAFSCRNTTTSGRNPTLATLPRHCCTASIPGALGVFPRRQTVFNMAIKKSDLYSSLWASCDELRGLVVDDKWLATLAAKVDAHLKKMGVQA